MGFARHAVQGEGQLTLQAALGRLSLAVVTVYYVSTGQSRSVSFLYVFIKRIPVYLSTVAEPTIDFLPNSLVNFQPMLYLLPLSTQSTWYTQ